MVDEAVARAKDGRYAQIRGRVCDVQALPFKDDAFDVVIANHMLYHVPDPDRGVAELARVVHRDGVVLAATNGYGLDTATSNGSRWVSEANSPGGNDNP